MRTAVVAVLTGLVSAAAVSGIILGTGIGDEDNQSRPVAVGAAPAAAPSLRDVFTRAQRAIVRVDARPPGTPIPSGPPTRADGVATGTGFVIDSAGSIVTNDHVAAGGSKVSVRFGEHGKRVDARVIGRDPSTDLALLRIDAKAAAFTPLALGDSHGVHVGDPAIAIGNPFGLERSLTLGVVSATDREIDAPNGTTIRGVVQTDAAINPGSSGGPLLDADGRVIGVNSQAREGASGIGFAVPVDTLKKRLPDLRSGKRPQQPFLGVSLGSGARIADLEPGGPAADAGLRRGDTIVSLDGRPVRAPGDVAAAVQRRRVGDRVTVVVRRGGRRITVRATLARRP
jgi:S1-C subfamily serine protease